MIVFLFISSIVFSVQSLRISYVVFLFINFSNYSILFRAMIFFDVNQIPNFLFTYIFYYYHFFKSPVLAAAPDNYFPESSYHFLSSSRVSAPIFPNPLIAGTPSYFFISRLNPPFSFFMCISQ